MRLLKILIFLILLSTGQSECICDGDKATCIGQVFIEEIYQLSCKPFVTDLIFEKDSIFDQCPIDISGYVPNIRTIHIVNSPLCTCFKGPIDCQGAVQTKNQSNSKNLIIGLVILGLLILMAIIAMIALIRYKKKRRNRRRDGGQQIYRIDDLQNRLERGDEEENLGAQLEAREVEVANLKMQVTAANAQIRHAQKMIDNYREILDDDDEAMAQMKECEVRMQNQLMSSQRQPSPSFSDDEEYRRGLGSKFRPNPKQTQHYVAGDF